MRRSIPVALACAALLGAVPAAARVELAGPDELSGHILVQGALADNTPGGFKFFHEYGYQLTERMWFNGQLNWVLGSDRDCVQVRGERVCEGEGNFDGNTLELAAGVKLKFNTLRAPLIPYAKVGGALNLIFFGNDTDAVALGVRGGGGVKYFFYPNFGVGGELVLTLGPQFGALDGLYAAMDFAGGVEFLF